MKSPSPWYQLPLKADWFARAVIALVLLTLLVPAFSDSARSISITNQILVALPAALSVYLMMRMDLVSFAIPAFMCIGGFAAALCGLHLGTNVLLQMAASFVAPMLVAIPIGLMVLRLKGAYFVLVTYVLAEIVHLLLLEIPAITGGTNGLAGLPATTLFSWTFGDNRSVLLVAIFTAVVAVLVTLLTTRLFRDELDAIRLNELLARSFGLTVWRYKVICFCIAAGLAGLAGFSLVNLLLTAHPSSFNPITGLNYVAYVYIGGRLSILGPVLGTALLVWAAQQFNMSGEYSQALFGLLLIAIVMLARGGLVGLLESLGARVSALVARPAPASTPSSAKTQPEAA
ncbi:branched-chain amino acid ABC transporter permease [Diaphorobacter sp. HDW4A]|uniref:branched-chain amino acid ABC transporter permease n=1 Tax=Diaphorobacter sp. HDW4A TaxID=2714924 RepID=UPI00140E4A9A|nr:branched-chain amino acid ABC transporter permease [Diaphorobacter sp. HDW4A]QIL80186.1 branched-chain amino acid ABC transporter permease [Diaphorobacter sp. HDW4A]